MSRVIQIWAIYGAHADVHCGSCVDSEDCRIRSEGLEEM